MNVSKFIFSGVMLCITTGCNVNVNSDEHLNNFTYQSIKINDQTWMAENLNTSKFKNGDAIPEAQSEDEWLNANKKGQPAWCYYEGNTLYEKKYCKLYNWYAVIDSRGLAPEGWHIPTDSEWTTLIYYLGGDIDACSKLKSQNGWHKNGNGNNSSEFNALPGGARNTDASWIGVNDFGNWWSSTSHDTNTSWARSIEHNLAFVFRYNLGKGTGLSVRCIKDKND